MKTALAIVCSLLLVGVTKPPTQALAAGDATGICCGCACSSLDCCVAEAVPESQPVSASPAPSFSVSQFLKLPSASVAWTLPAIDSESPAPTLLPLATAAAPLFERNCIRLI